MIRPITALGDTSALTVRFVEQPKEKVSGPIFHGSHSERRGAKKAKTNSVGEISDLGPNCDVQSAREMFAMKI